MALFSGGRSPRQSNCNPSRAFSAPAGRAARSRGQAKRSPRIGDLRGAAPKVAAGKKPDRRQRHRPPQPGRRCLGIGHPGASLAASPPRYAPGYTPLGPWGQTERGFRLWKRAGACSHQARARTIVAHNPWDVNVSSKRPCCEQRRQGEPLIEKPRAKDCWMPACRYAPKRTETQTVKPSCIRLSLSFFKNVYENLHGPRRFSYTF